MEERCEVLRDAIVDTSSEYEKEKLQERPLALTPSPFTLTPNP